MWYIAYVNFIWKYRGKVRKAMNWQPLSANSISKQIKFQTSSLFFKEVLIIPGGQNWLIYDGTQSSEKRKKNILTD